MKGITNRLYVVSRSRIRARDEPPRSWMSHHEGADVARQRDGTTLTWADSSELLPRE
jgi:hypothetical protein